MVLAGKLGVKKIVMMSGCSAGAPGDKTPNWITSTISWPDYMAPALEYQWNEVAIPWWKKFVEHCKAHGVEQIAPAYECDQQEEEVSLMITKHCLRYSFDQCPKERGPGFKPDPLQLTIGPDTFRLRFDCKRCEMHVLGRLKGKKR